MNDIFKSLKRLCTDRFLLIKSNLSSVELCNKSNSTCEYNCCPNLNNLIDKYKESNNGI